MTTIASRDVVQRYFDALAAGGAIEAGVPGATRVVLPGSGHLPHLEVPEAFNRLVHEFLTKG